MQCNISINNSGVNRSGISRSVINRSDINRSATFASWVRQRLGAFERSSRGEGFFDVAELGKASTLIYSYGPI